MAGSPKDTWQLGEGEDMLVHAPGAGGHLPSVNPTRRPFGSRSVAARPASNGSDLDGSTEQSKNHEDPRCVAACGGTATTCGGKLAN